MPPRLMLAAEIEFPDGRKFRVFFPLDPKKERPTDGEKSQGDFLLKRMQETAR